MPTYFNVYRLPLWTAETQMSLVFSGAQVPKKQGLD